MIISGIVKKGKSRGKRLGFPTINFDLSKKITEGVYFSQIIINGKKYNSLTFIGSARTFNEKEYHAETYILDFSNDIYGEKVEVLLLKKIRNNIKFNSEEELIKQMKKDKKQAEDFFKGFV